MKLNNTLLNSQRVKKEVLGEIEKYIKMSDGETTKYEDMWDRVKAVLKRLRLEKRKGLKSII